MTETEHILESIIAETPDDIFETAGGFAYTDEIALRLSERWRKSSGAVVVSLTDLAWLIDGYARARLSPDLSRLVNLISLFGADALFREYVAQGEISPEDVEVLKRLGVVR